MTPVYQTIVDKGNGNCLQAAIASLLDLTIEEVPHFISYGERWYEVFREFLLSKGYHLHPFLVNSARLGVCGEDEFWQFAQRYPSVRGCYYASVYSPGMFDANEFCTPGIPGPTTHAVLIDNEFNIVHDPNPKYAGTKQYPLWHHLGYNGVLSVTIITDLYGQ